MTGHCCMTGQVGQAIRLPCSKATASIVPAVILFLLPKCPLCIAAWLTVATGVSVSASGVSWARATVVLVWIAVVAWMIGRRAAITSRSR